MKSHLIIGARGSPLSLAQTETVVRALKKHHPGLTVSVKPIRTGGDDLSTRSQSLGLKGLFVQEIEKALLKGEIDLAVHSAKDLPQDLPPGLALGPVPLRGPVHDSLVSVRGLKLKELPLGARVGTSSLRRQTLLLAARPDLAVVPIRGNLDTRLAQLTCGRLEATVLAAAGLNRLGRSDWPQIPLPPESFLPAPGQGSLALEYREGDRETLDLISPLNHHQSAVSLALERGVTFELGAGCHTPAAAWAKLEGQRWHLRAMVALPQGQHILRAEAYLDVDELNAARELGRNLAQTLLAQGGAEILAQLDNNQGPEPEEIKAGHERP
ncbi:MAG: hydroxymethylbilane synthase [Deltaproteobacteria bacterium]|nr:hydroxymethylbilane synthase [Deltaproteobacteria bacterium]